MKYTVAEFGADQFMKSDLLDMHFDGIVERLVNFEKEHQIYDAELWERFVELFRFPAKRRRDRALP